METIHFGSILKNKADLPANSVVKKGPLMLVEPIEKHY